MTGMLRVNTRVYDGILRLYPVDLRREFGPDIRAAFAEDLEDAWQFRGLAGAASIWWYAMCELFRIALPGVKANPQIAVPLVSLGFNVVVVGIEALLYLFYATAPKGLDGALSVWSAGKIVFGTSVVVTLIAWAVVRASRVEVTALGLNS